MAQDAYQRDAKAANRLTVEQHAAVLNAIPAHVARLDHNGVILAVAVERHVDVTQRQLAETLAIETRRLHDSQAVVDVGSWGKDGAAEHFSGNCP